MPDWIGNGECWGPYNTQECGWDGGDCLFDVSDTPSGTPTYEPSNTQSAAPTEFVNENDSNCRVDCLTCIGNGVCDGGDYNTLDCGYDGGDCIEFNNIYPNCHVHITRWIGDGKCDGGEYDTQECGWDGGDCVV